MINLILFDDESWQSLLPLTYTRPICELRLGMLTIAEKWERILGVRPHYLTQEHLSVKYKFKLDSDNLLINGSFIPNEYLITKIKDLGFNQALYFGEELIAAHLDKESFDLIFEQNNLEQLEGEDLLAQGTDLVKLQRPTDILRCIDSEISRDFKLVTAGKDSAKGMEHCTVIGDHPVFLEEGAKATCAILNATNGPIYLGKNAEVMEGALIRGPFYLGDRSHVKMGAKIYEGVSVGPDSKVGGELKTVVIQGNSNKGHEGFLGDSILGEWCNLGADTNTSNLKNNYEEVKLWNYATGRFEKTGLQFCGLIMGDHSKCGINTMFNTGTVVGVFCNIFGEGYPRNFIPSYAWGGTAGYMTYKLEKAFDTARIVMARRGKILDEIDMDILRHIFYQSDQYRVWEKATKS